ncbi:MAG: hypothetical protein U0797_12425 [Gemmataceae bacterium]
MPRSCPVALLLLAGLAPAQSPPTIESVRVGLPTGQGGCSRNGAWAPVAVTLRGGKGGNPQGAYRVRVETTDLEEVAYQTSAPVPALSADTPRAVTAYTVPVGDGSAFRVTLEDAQGKAIQSLAPQPRDVGRDLVVGQDDVLFFGVGGGLSGLKRAGERLDKPDAKEPEPDQARRQFALTDDVAALPDRWVGYDAVDVVVLGTGKRDFVLRLAQEGEAARREALVEWVRRGGQLVVSVGPNTQEVSSLLAKMPLLDVRVAGGEMLANLPVISNQWSDRVNLAPLQQVQVAALKPGPAVNVLVREARKPVIVQSACGLGRVVLVAFDLDAPPFSTWDGQEAFWARLQKEVAPTLPGRTRGKPGVADAARPAPRGGAPGQERYDYRAELQRGLETFEEAPTISFGWVALFLLGYILLVGPLDYFILKKLFKRLELTWVTFPLMVLAVSVAAYCTAYAVKGDDLRFNKIDLVDVDQHGPGQVYGTSWVTLFSPRVASYTLGLQPADGWAGPVPEGEPKPVVTVLEAGDRTFRVASQELFRRPYLYADDESGLVRVPIPVWATRSFSASWRAPVRPKSPPPVGFTDDVGPVRLARDGRALVGRLTNHLPVRLLGVTLIHRERCYSLGTLEPGESRRVEPLFAADAQGQGRDLTAWLADSSLSHGLPLAPTGRPLNANFLNERESFQVVKSLMFYRANERAGSTNAGLRRLDQTWRLRSLPEYPIPERPRYRDEVVLVARTPMLSDAAEDVTSHPASPSQLWLGELPAAGRDRPPLKGFLTQETYLRVFIPVR